MASSSSVQDPLESNQDAQQPPPRLQQQQRPLKDCTTFKTKTVQFLGRSTPIVLQNENGPCSLISICNVLLLRNSLQLSPHIAEVELETLLSKVADLLIESNNNMKNKGEKVTEALQLLPTLATGMDVNLNFTRIDDFDDTPGLEIFALLDIPLCHGWLVDPQDNDTANAIGSKSFNDLSKERAARDAQNIEDQYKNTQVDDGIDFLAVTTPDLGVPSPSHSSHFISDNQIQREEDLEELFRALEPFEPDSPSVSDPVVGHINTETVSPSIDENICNEEVIAVDSGDKSDNSPVVGNSGLYELESSLPDGCMGPVKSSNEQTSSASTLGEAAKLSLKIDAADDLDHSTCMRIEEYMGQNDVVGRNSLSLDTLVQNESSALLSLVKDSVSLHRSHTHNLVGDKNVSNQSTFTTSDHEVAEDPHGNDATRLSCLSAEHTNSDLSSGEIRETDASEALASSVGGSEPICEGEDCVLGTSTEESTLADTDVRAKNKIIPRGELIRNFLDGSQLTMHGLLCLREDLQDDKLYVLFHNNHFSTMFKHEGQLYTLVTDQGYINMPDLVWEQLNEIKGNTTHMTGEFERFVVERDENNNWDEHNARRDTAVNTWDVHNARRDTAEYLGRIGSAEGAGLTDITSDLQLAIALQRQELGEIHNNFSCDGSSSQITYPEVASQSGRHSDSSTSSEDEESTVI